jgi:hypothetical protein
LLFLLGNILPNSKSCYFQFQFMLFGITTADLKLFPNGLPSLYRSETLTSLLWSIDEISNIDEYWPKEFVKLDSGQSAEDQITSGTQRSLSHIWSLMLCWDTAASFMESKRL